MFPFLFSIPYRPLIGAVSESMRMRWGCWGTVWYVPGIGDPSASRLYVPAGITQVAIAARTISANRIVYAEGRVNRRFFPPSSGGVGSRAGSSGSVAVVVSSLMATSAHERRRDRPRADVVAPVVVPAPGVAQQPDDQQRDQHAEDPSPGPAHHGLLYSGSRSSGQVMQ